MAALRVGLRGLVLLVALALGGPAAAEPGCPVLDFTWQNFQVDAGALSSRVARRVTVAAGDTLGALAQRHLGSVRRTPQILALNPGLDPKTLRVGTELWLPAASDAGEWMELLLLPSESSPWGGEPVLARESQWRKLPLGPVRVAALPASHLRELRRLGGGRLRVEALEHDPQVALSAPLDARAQDGAAVSRGVTRVRVRAVEGRRLLLDVLEQTIYSASGHRVALASEAPLEHGSLAAPLLLVLGVLVLFALVAWAARRMAAPAGTDAPRP